MTDHIEQQMDVATIDPETVRRATLTVCDHAANPVEAQELLQMLGLVEPVKTKPLAPKTFRPFCIQCNHPIVSGRGVPPKGARRHAAGNVCSFLLRPRPQTKGGTLRFHPLDCPVCGSTQMVIVVNLWESDLIPCPQCTNSRELLALLEKK